MQVRYFLKHKTIFRGKKAEKLKKKWWSIDTGLAHVNRTSSDHMSPMDGPTCPLHLHRFRMCRSRLQLQFQSTVSVCYYPSGNSSMPERFPSFHDHPLEAGIQWESSTPLQRHLLPSLFGCHVWLSVSPVIICIPMNVLNFE